MKIRNIVIFAVLASVLGLLLAFRKVFFAWYDFWVGAYWDRKNKVLYVCPLPCVVIKLELRRKKENHNEM